MIDAKPIVDMLLAVPDSADEQAYIPAMEAAGLLHIREPLWHKHRLFKGSDLDVNLHVFFSHGSSEIPIMYMLAKRKLVVAAKLGPPGAACRCGRGHYLRLAFFRRCGGLARAARP
jgi:hypothetical protein